MFEKVKIKVIIPSSFNFIVELVELVKVIITSF